MRWSALEGSSKKLTTQDVVELGWTGSIIKVGSWDGLDKDDKNLLGMEKNIEYKGLWKENISDTRWLGTIKDEEDKKFSSEQATLLSSEWVELLSGCILHDRSCCAKEKSCLSHEEKTLDIGTTLEKCIEPCTMKEATL